MTSRERVLAAFSHTEPDRPPIDLGATRSSSISAVAYARLRKALAVDAGQVAVYDLTQQLALPEEWFLERFGIDVVDVARSFMRAGRHESTLAGERVSYPPEFAPAERPDGSRVAVAGGIEVGTMPAGGSFYDQASFPYRDGWPASFSGLAGAIRQTMWGAWPGPPWDHAGEDRFDERLREAVIAHRDAGRATVITVGCNLFEWGTFLRGMEEFLVDLLLQPATVEAFLEAIMEIHLARLDFVCRAVGDVVDVIRFGDDLGTDSGPIMSPAVYRRLFKPRQRRLCDFVHGNSQARILLHSCGSIAELIPDLIDAGFQMINPVQSSARGMELSRLKREYGRDLVFWGGGAETRGVLNHGTTADVRRDVRERARMLAPGGGFVFAAIHNVLADVPPENIVAMLEEAGASYR